MDTQGFWDRVRRRGRAEPSIQSEIAASGVVDREWYLEQNPDVRHAGMDPVRHFEIFGFREGRQPNPFFTGRWYDVATVLDDESAEPAGSDPPVLSDEIQLSGIVDGNWYLQRYPDVAAAQMDPVRHFARHGLAEGRQPNPFFSRKWYVDKHPEVAACHLDPVLHYIRHGAALGFDPHPLFDSRLYLSSRPGVQRKDALKDYLHSRHAGGHDAPMRFPGPPAAIGRYPKAIQRRILTSPILMRLPAANYLAAFFQLEGFDDDGLGSVEEFVRRSHERQQWISGSFRRSDLALIVEMERRRRRLATEYSTRPQHELVSVIMPTRNRLDTIVDAINSVVVQTYGNWELVVVDDGGDDRLEPLIASYDDDRIRLVRHDDQRGEGATRNTGLAHASGTAIVHLDDDDQCDPDFLLVSLHAMRDAGKRMFYCAQMLWQGFDDATMTGRNFHGILYRDFDRARLEQGNYLSMSVVIHDRELVGLSGAFDESLTHLVDWDFFLRMTEVETPARLPVVMHHYYRHRVPGSITATAPIGINVARIREKLAERRASGKVV